MKKGTISLDELSPQDVFLLMDIYLSEWMHRDELLWVQVYKYFYATLIVLFLPNVADFLKIELPKLPTVLFPIAALVLSFLFLYVTIGYTKRLEAIGKTYQNIIDLLPPSLRRIPLEDPEIKHGKFFNYKMSVIVCLLLFLGLAVLSVLMFWINLKK